MGHTLAHDLLGAAAEHLSIGLADEAISQIGTAPNENEWRLFDDRVQLGLALAQIVGEHLEAIGVTGAKDEECSEESSA